MQISVKAAEKLKEIIATQDNPDHTLLRVAFRGFGWGGPQLSLTLDELTHEDDISIESQGITVVYDANLEQYVSDSVIDYSDNSLNRGFSIKSEGLSSC